MSVRSSRTAPPRSRSPTGPRRTARRPTARVTGWSSASHCALASGLTISWPVPARPVGAEPSSRLPPTSLPAFAATLTGPDNGDVIDIDPARFEEMVAVALDGLPAELGSLMRNVVVLVEHEDGPPGLLGLYEGVPLTSRSTYYSGVLPDRITIYRRARRA